ncbi:Ubiquinone biosynthesis protein [Podochytrium sp. JEL0797]|nr:Ubiquinone biosynthesis protein [Podochytrium sp. JEL0797]
MLYQLPMAARAGFKALRNPSREDMVAALGELTGSCALQRMRTKMVLDPTGRRLLKNRPLINTQTIDMAKLRAMPKDSLGRAYVNFCDIECVGPDTRTPVKYMPEADDELKYVMLRYRQTHDFFHVLTGLGTSLEEEIAVKWFELAQTGLPMNFLGGVLGPLRLSSADRKLLFTQHVPWLVSCGASSKFLMNVYYEEMLDQKMDDVRKELGIFLPEGFVPQDKMIKD